MWRHVDSPRFLWHAMPTNTAAVRVAGFCFPPERSEERAGGSCAEDAFPRLCATRQMKLMTQNGIRELAHQLPKCSRLFLFVWAFQRYLPESRYFLGSDLVTVTSTSHAMDGRHKGRVRVSEGCRHRHLLTGRPHLLRKSIRRKYT